MAFPLLLTIFVASGDYGDFGETPLMPVRVGMHYHEVNALLGRPLHGISNGDFSSGFFASYGDLWVWFDGTNRVEKVKVIAHEARPIRDAANFLCSTYGCPKLQKD